MSVLFAYDKLEEGFDYIKAETLGWQTIGRGAYTFGELVKLYGPEVFERHNWAPPHFEEVQEKQFACMNDHLRYPLIATTYRQIEADEYGCKLGYMLEGHLFLNSLGNGYMLHFDFYKRRTRYFIFRFCFHDYETTRQRGAYIEMTCTKCRHLRKLNE